MWRREQFLALGRIHPQDSEQPLGLSALALRASRHANAVSRRHGEVARAMWQPLFLAHAVNDVPITHVTNGVRVPTWLNGPMRRLLDQYLGNGWLHRADQTATWAPVADIPAQQLWAARCEARRALVDLVARRGAGDRLRRGDPLDYAEAVGSGFDPDRLTIGFARRIATDKRLHLVALLPERSLALLSGEHPVQFVFAGKAHPDDTTAKEVVRQVFSLKWAPGVAGRVAFLEDYDIPLAGHLVSGCDVWPNEGVWIPSNVSVRCPVDQDFERTLSRHVRKHRWVLQTMRERQLRCQLLHLVLQEGNAQLRRIQAQQDMATGIQ